MKLFMIANGAETETTDTEIVKRIVEAMESHGDTEHDDLDNLGSVKPQERVWILEQYSHWLKPETVEFRNSYGNKRIDRPRFETNRDRRRRLVRETHVARALERVGGDQETVCEFGYYDEENGPQMNTHNTTVKTMLEEIYSTDMKWNRRRSSLSYSSSVLREIKTLQDVFDSYDGHECLGDVSVGFIGTEKEFEKREQDRRRKELESLASEIAHKHKVSVNSLEFLKALDKEIRSVEYAREDWNNPECRMEEWAACRYAGVGTDVYFDDLNFVNGRISSQSNNLYDVREWLAENCPLLYAQYTEQCLANQGEEDEEEDEEVA